MEYKRFKLTKEQVEKLTLFKGVYEDLKTNATIDIIEAVTSSKLSTRDSASLLRESLRMLFHQSYFEFRHNVISDSDSFEDGIVLQVDTSVKDHNIEVTSTIERFVLDLGILRLYLKNLDLTNRDTFYEYGIDEIYSIISDFTESVSETFDEKLADELKEYRLDDEQAEL